MGFAESAISTTKDLTQKLQSNMPLHGHHVGSRETEQYRPSYQHQHLIPPPTPPKSMGQQFHKNPTVESDLDQWRFMEAYPYEMTNEESGRAN